MHYIDHEYRCSQKNGRRTHVVTDLPEHHCDNAARNQKAEHGNPAFQVPSLRRNQRCHEDNHNELHWLRHLKLHTRNSNPAGRTFYRDTQRRLQKKDQSDTGNITNGRKPAPEMVIDGSHHQHCYNSKHRIDDLIFQKIHGIIIVSLAHACRIIAGTVDHDKSEHHDKDQHYQKIGIQPACPRLEQPLSFGHPRPPVSHIGRI